MNKNINFTITEKIKQQDRNLGLLSGRKHILVGLSGGADSCALLLALHTLSQEFGYGLSAIHVNHGIRGQEAERDALFSQNLCKKIGVPFFLEEVDVPSVCEKTGKSLETCARNLRYELFEKVCKENNIFCVATAHTASDNAETVLFNLIRGSGLSGACGIPCKRLLGSTSIEIIRPLLSVTRCEIEEYLLSVGQDYVTDSTNLLDDCSRNYIRHELIPLIKKLNASFEENVCSFVSSVTYDKEYLENVTKECITDDILVISGMHMAQKSRVIKYLYNRVKPDFAMLEWNHVLKIVQEVDLCAQGDKKSSFVSLPGKIKAVISQGKLSFTNDSREKNNDILNYEFPLLLGINVMPDKTYLLYVAKDEKKLPDVMKYMENVYKKYNTGYLYFDTILDSLCVRNRRKSDTFYFKGMNRKVKKLFSDYDIPLEIREKLPFVTLDGNIVYIPKIGVNDAFSKCSHKENILQIALYLIS